MGESTTGAKAGAVAGLIFGIVETVTLPLALGQTQTVLSFISTLIPLLLEGTVVGLVFGVIFNFAKDKFMINRSLPFRGLVFGLAPFAFNMILNLSVLIQLPDALFIIQELVVNLLYGYLVGYFFERFDSEGRITVSNDVPQYPV